MPSPHPNIFTSISQVGLDLVTDRATRTPAPALASWLLHRLRVIIIIILIIIVIAVIKFNIVLTKKLCTGSQAYLFIDSMTFMVPSVTTLTNMMIIQEKRVLLAKEGEHGNVIYIVPPICINEDDVTQVMIITMIMIATIIVIIIIIILISLKKIL